MGHADHSEPDVATDTAIFSGAAISQDGGTRVSSDFAQSAVSRDTDCPEGLAICEGRSRTQSQRYRRHNPGIHPARPATRQR